MTPGAFWEGSRHVLGELWLAGDRLFAAGVSALLIIATLGFVYGTWTGRALMATAQNRVGATIVGVDPVTDRKNNPSIGIVVGVSEWSLSGSMSAREQTCRGRRDAIWSWQT